MKKVRILGTLLLMACLLLSTTVVVAEEGQTYRIGILQYVEHAALDAAVEGFKDGLAEAGFVEGENLTIEFHNASGDQTMLQMAADQLIAGGNDLLLGVATSAVQTLAAQTEIPVLGTAVTDYVESGLVASNEAPGINVSGTSDMNPVAAQVQLMAQLVPDAQTFGVLYTSSEPNSQLQAKLMKEEAEKLGIPVIEKTITAVGDVQQAAESLASQVDIIYVPTDNIIASAVTVLADVSVESGVPVVPGESNMCAVCGVATYGLNYYNLGKQTAAMAVRILVDGANPAEMPIEILEEYDAVINQSMADQLGIEIPAELLEGAVVTE